MRTYKYLLTSMLLVAVLNTSAQTLEDARRAVDAERYQAAKTMLKAMLRSQPKAAELYYSLGEAYLKTGYIDSAKNTFAQGIRASKKNPMNYAGLGLADLQLGNPSAAKINFDKAVSYSSRRQYNAYLAIGNGLIAAVKPDFNTTLAYFKKADELDKSDKNPQVFLAYGNLFAAQGKFQEAVEQYIKTVDLDPAIQRAKASIAETYFRAGNTIKSDSLLTALLVEDNTYGPAYRLLAEHQLKAYLKDRRDIKAAGLALDNYRRYLDATDRSFDSRLQYAKLLYELGEFKDLEKELSTLQTMSAGDRKAPIIARLSGYAAYENGNYPAALQYLTMMIGGNDDIRQIVADDYVYLSLTQQQLQQADAALENASKAIKLDSSKTAALDQIARTYYGNRNWIKAIETYELIKQLGGSPENLGELSLYHGTALYFRYVESFNRQEQPSLNLLAQAKTLFDQTIKFSPDLIIAHLWSARTLSLMEDQFNIPPGAMVAAYQAYIEASEKSNLAQTAATKRNLVEACNAIAAYAFAKSDRDTARLYWSKALSLDSEDVTAVAGLKLLSAPTRSGKRK